jgi:hypothetical protein
LVVEMAHTALTPLLGKEYDGFLLATVGEERNGMTLSVLSALARLDVDPWEETAALASMPRERAKERLAALFASSTKALATGSSADMVAARLIALLPTASSFRIPAPVAAVKAKVPSVVILLGVLLVVLVSLTMYFGAPQLPSLKFNTADRAANPALSQ